MPTNFPKIPFVLNNIPEIVKSRLNELSWVDFGAGPGSLSLGLLSELKTQNKKITIVEESAEMLEQAKKLFPALSSDSLVSFQQRLSGNEEKGQALLLGNVVNELTEEYFFELVKKLRPEMLFLIDIGTKEFFLKMNSIRSQLLNLGFEVNYPCLCAKICPMTGTEDWCHQKINVTQPQEWERIGQKIQNDRRTLPFSAFVFSNIKNEQQSIGKYRVIRKFPENKFSFSFIGCDEHGELSHIELLKRFLNKEQKKYLKALDWGESLKVKIIKESGHKKRGELDNG